MTNSRIRTDSVKQYFRKLIYNKGEKNTSRKESVQYGIDSYYSSDKPEKDIILPKTFVADTFLSYSERPHYSVLVQIIDQKREQTILPAIDAGGLCGCGGAHFPVAKKWRAALENPGPRCLIVNGQEGEPYTFKDYMLMKCYPHIVIEGAVLAALALEVDEVIIAINSSYEECLHNISQALQNVLNEFPELEKISFRVTPGPKPDLYICGEETALIEYLEHRRGEAQLKPPFPFQSGYRGQPTIIQNVETLAWIPLFVDNPDSFAKNNHPKLLQISGSVNAPGIYEAPIGCDIYSLLAMAGGMSDNAPLQAIEVGGLAGGFLPPHCLTLSLNHKIISQYGAAIGTGSIRFLDHNTNLIEIALQAMSFFKNESCGRCSPCRIGTHELVRIAQIMTARTLDSNEQTWFEEITQTMINTSICGLGKGAPNILVSLLRYWSVENGNAQLKHTSKIDPQPSTIHQA